VSGASAAVKRSFPPIVGDNPRVLILGTLPGEESLRRREY
jgi:G:T/U-mismatch repair DNA glycosylase